MDGVPLFTWCPAGWYGLTALPAPRWRNRPGSGYPRASVRADAPTASPTPRAMISYAVFCLKKKKQTEIPSYRVRDVDQAVGVAVRAHVLGLTRVGEHTSEAQASGR